MPVPNEQAKLAPKSDPRLTALFRGAWARNGGGVAKHGEYARLTSRTGLTILVDREAVELAAMALGVLRPCSTEAPSTRGRLRQFIGENVWLLVLLAVVVAASTWTLLGTMETWSR